MPATLLFTRRVDKPWGRHRLWPGFADPGADAEPVGEVWFETPGDSAPDLLVKYLFTSEKLSVQVHPDDAAARAAGYPRGKDEAWVILDADPDSTIAIGTLHPMSQDELRAAALDGSIEHLLDWKPVRKNDFFYSPAGTVHAIGAGITLIEVQQNVDLTYRLYDYGRPRALHLDQGVAVSDAKPFVARQAPGHVAEGRTILAAGPKFVLERRAGGTHDITLAEGVSAWLVPITGQGVADGVAFSAGECLTLAGQVSIHAGDGSDLLIAYPGSEVIG